MESFIRNPSASICIPLASCRRSMHCAIAGFMLLLLNPGAFAQCGQKIQTAEYNLCVPRGWNIVRNDQDDSVSTCNRSERQKCASDPFGYPYPGALVVTILPSDRGYGIFQSPEDLIRRARQTGQPLPTISEVLVSRRKGGPESKCWVARTLMPGDLWMETYSLTVGDRRFRVSVLYNNEPNNIGSFRDAILKILSSVTPHAE